MIQTKIVRTAIALLASAAVLMSAHSSAEPTKVGFVYVGPTGDAGWTYAHDKGRQYVDDKFGDAVETTYVESVAEGADSERVIKTYEGSNLQVLKGRYGPYITDGKKNGRIPKDREPDSLPLKECKEIIAAAPARKKRARRAKKKTSTA